MGRWVTSKGRRIYIPDEGEENPFTKDDIGPERRRAKETTQNAEARDKYQKDYNALSEDEKKEIDRQLLKNHPDWYPNSNKKQTTSTKEESIPGIKEWARNQDKIRKENEALREEIKANREESIKQKQIDSNKAQADERNGKKSKEDIARDKETFKKAKEHEARVKTKTQASKQAIRDAKAAIKQYGPSRGMWKDIKQADKEWQKISKAFAAGEISQEAYTEAYHIFGPNFHSGYKVRHKKKGNK